MNLLERISRNVGWSMVSEMLGKGLLFFTSIYLARILGAGRFGIFTFAQATTQYFWLAADMGITMYGIREIARHREDRARIINSLLTLRIMSGLIVFALYSISLIFFDMPVVNRLTYLGCGFYLLTYATYPDWILKGLEKFKHISLGSIAASSFFLIAIFSVVKASGNPAAAAIAWSLSFLFGTASLMYVLKKLFGISYRPSFDYREWIRHLRESIFFTISGGLIVTYQYFPILILKVFYTSYEVGIFSAPYKIVTGAGTFGLLVAMAYYPIFSDLFQRDKATFFKAHARFRNIMLVAGAAIGAVCMIYGKNIVEFVFGIQYMESVVLFKTLVWLIPLYLLRYSYGTVLMATGFQRIHNIATIGGASCMAISGLLLIPKFGAMGSAISLVVSETVFVTFLISFFYMKLNRPYK